MRRYPYQPGLITPPDLQEWIERTGYQPPHQTRYLASVISPSSDDEAALYQQIAEAESEVEDLENEEFFLEAQLEEVREKLSKAEDKVERLIRDHRANQRERLNEQPEPINAQVTLRIGDGSVSIVNIRALGRGER